MNKLNPKNKICFRNNLNIRAKQKLLNLKSKKWNIFRKKIKYRKELKPENRNKFFQKRLFEKQQFQFFYNIKKYQLKNLFNKLYNKQNKTNIFQNFIVLLESRLDITLVRLKFVRSVFHAQQLINHNKIKVNNKKINKINLLLKKGDIITKVNEYKKKKTLTI